MSRKLLMCQGKIVGYVYDKVVTADYADGNVDFSDDQLIPVYKYGYLMEAKGRTSFPGATDKIPSRNVHKVAETDTETGKYKYTIISSSADGTKTKSVNFYLDHLLDEVDRTASTSSPAMHIDRLYWDETSSEYLLEVNTKHEIHDKCDQTLWDINPGNYNIIERTLDTTIPIPESGASTALPMISSNYYLVSWGNSIAMNGIYNQCTLSWTSNDTVRYGHMLGKAPTEASQDELDALFTIPMHIIYAVETQIIRTGIKKKIKVPLFGNGTTFALKHTDILYDGSSISGEQITYGSIEVEIPCVDEVIYQTFEGEGVTLTEGDYSVHETSKVYFEGFDGKMTTAYACMDSDSDEYEAIEAYQKAITLGERIDDDHFLFKIVAKSANGSKSETVEFILPDMVCPYADTMNDSTVTYPNCYVEWSDEQECYVYYSNSEYILLDNIDTFKYGSFRQALVQQYSQWTDKTAWRSPVMTQFDIMPLDDPSTTSNYPYGYYVNADICEPYYVGGYVQNPIITWSSYSTTSTSYAASEEDRKHTFTMVVKSTTDNTSTWYDTRDQVNDHLAKYPVELILPRNNASQLTPILTDITKKIELPYFGPGTTYSLEKESDFGEGAEFSGNLIDKQVANIRVSVPTTNLNIIEYKDYEAAEVKIGDTDLSISRYDKLSYLKEICFGTTLDKTSTTKVGYTIEYFNDLNPDVIKTINLNILKNMTLSSDTQTISSLIWDDVYGQYLARVVSSYNFEYIETGVTEKIAIPLTKGATTTIRALELSQLTTGSIVVEAPIQRKEVTIPEPTYSLPTTTYFTGSSSATAPNKSYIDTGVKLFDTQKDFTILLEFEPNGTLSNKATVFHSRYNSGNYRGLAIDYNTDYNTWRMYGDTTVNSGNILDGTYNGLDDTNPSESNWRYRTLIRYVNGYPDRIINLIDRRKDSEVACYDNFYDYDLYVNDENTNTWPAWASHTRNVLLGCYETTSGSRSKYFTGWINECKIWNGTALTDEQIEYLFNGSIPRPSFRAQNISISGTSTMVNTGIALLKENAYQTKLDGATIIIDFSGPGIAQSHSKGVFWMSAYSAYSEGVGIYRLTDDTYAPMCTKGYASYAAADTSYRIKMNNDRGIIIFQFRHLNYGLVLDRIIEATDGGLKEIPLYESIRTSAMGTWSKASPIILGGGLSDELTYDTSSYWVGTINDCMIWSGLVLSDTQLLYVIQHMLNK